MIIRDKDGFPIKDTLANPESLECKGFGFTIHSNAGGDHESQKNE
jgi:hypothetical protein